MLAELDRRQAAMSVVVGFAVAIIFMQLAMGLVLDATVPRYADPGQMGPPAREQAPERPSFIVILTDDQTVESMQAMPRTTELIFDQGLNFTQAYVTTPLCCPSRSSILTGMYAHNHGVRDNQIDLNASTVVQTLDEAGYFTGLVGKYLNSAPKIQHPWYDFWVTHWADYHDPTMNVRDDLEGYERAGWLPEDGYTEWILEAYALDFLDRAARSGEPFFLLFSPGTPHAPAEPPAAYEDMFTDLPPLRPPSHDEEDISDKPRWMQELPRLSEETIRTEDAFRLDQWRTLAALDLSIEQLLEGLETRGLLEGTHVIFLSDNGLFHGQHRLTFNKRFVYQPSVHVPMAWRSFDDEVPARSSDRLVANIDIAPTLLDLAGLPIPEEMDGRSLTALTDRGSDWRSELLLEGWPNRVAPGWKTIEPWATLGPNATPAWDAIHTGRYVYVETDGDLPEIYDLDEDPHQIDSKIGDPSYQELEDELRSRLHALRSETGKTDGPVPAAS